MSEKRQRTENTSEFDELWSQTPSTGKKLQTFQNSRPGSSDLRSLLEDPAESTQSYNPEQNKYIDLSQGPTSN